MFKSLIWTGGMTQWSRQLAGLPKNQNLVLNTHISWLISDCNPAPGDLFHSAGALLRAPTQIHINKNKTFKMKV